MPIPTPPMRSCVRFTRAGEPCSNLTDHADRWCRQTGCDGYLRSSHTIAPEVEEGRKVVGSKAQLRIADQRRPKGLDADDDLSEVRITRKAVESFRFHHGGSDDEARVELATMLEDFSLQSIGTTTGAGFLGLNRDGFSIVLSPERDAVVSYTTVHRERTWSQVKAGVKSRFGKSRIPSAPPPVDPGPQLEFDDPAELLVHLRAQPPRITRAAYTGAARALGTPRRFEDDEIALLDATWETDLNGDTGSESAVTRMDGGAFSIRGAHVAWLVSPDGYAVIGAKALAALDAASH